MRCEHHTVTTVSHVVGDGTRERERERETETETETETERSKWGTAFELVCVQGENQITWWSQKKSMKTLSKTPTSSVLPFTVDDVDIEEMR